MQPCGQDRIQVKLLEDHFNPHISEHFTALESFLDGEDAGGELPPKRFFLQFVYYLL
jgi:hypothetical protein